MNILSIEKLTKLGKDALKIFHLGLKAGKKWLLSGKTGAEKVLCCL